MARPRTVRGGKVTPNYVRAFLTDADIATQIIELRAQLANSRFYPDTYEFAPAMREEGIEFYDVNEAQYDSGWDVDKELVSWDDIANYKTVIPALELDLAVKKQRDGLAREQSRRDQYERLRKEFEGGSTS